MSNPIKTALDALKIAEAALKRHHDSDLRIAAAIAALEAMQSSEPVEYQHRTRPMWLKPNDGWSQWKPCSKGAYGDWEKIPVHNDWQNEVRKLYTAPQPAKQSAQPETEREEFLNFAEKEFPWLNTSYLSNKEGFYFELEEARMLFKTWQEAARQARGQSVPEGWQLVSIEPTKEMIYEVCHLGADIADIYSAMLEAAPKP